MRLFVLRLVLAVIACTTEIGYGFVLQQNFARQNLRKGVQAFVNRSPNSTPVAANLSGTAKHAVCNVTLPGYDDDRCLEQTIGRTRAQLEDEYRQSISTIKLAFSKQQSSCSKSAYIWSFEEFEELYPELSHCHITTYALLVESEALKFSCRAASAAQAQILMVPPYLGLECNWPGYGGGDCHKEANAHRHGTLCGKEVISVIAKLQAQHPDKPVLLVDDNSFWEVYNLPWQEYGVEGRIFAKSNTLTDFYRPKTDISLPPPPFSRCTQTPAKAYDEPLSSKRWFASFKGAFDTHPIRPHVAHLFHNNNDQIIVPSSNYNYDFDELLQQSRFILILRGHVEFSYRFNEAACSGGVPVLLTDKWVPPFNEIIPFQSYGVLVHERDVDKLMEVLRAIPDRKVESMRKIARRACQSAFGSVEATTRSLLTHLTAR